MIEVWKKIDNFHGLYEISNFGNVRIVLKEQKIELLKKRHKNKYLCVCLICKERYYTVAVHTLVARYFVENPLNKRTIDHINGNIYDNRASNLRWSTQGENLLYALLLKPNGKVREWKIERLKKRIENGF